MSIQYAYAFGMIDGNAPEYDEAICPRCGCVTDDDSCNVCAEEYAGEILRLAEVCSGSCDQSEFYPYR